MADAESLRLCELLVSMESGLEDRNNRSWIRRAVSCTQVVSMESGLEDRNNRTADAGR